MVIEAVTALCLADPRHADVVIAHDVCGEKKGSVVGMGVWMAQGAELIGGDGDIGADAESVGEDTGAFAHVISLIVHFNVDDTMRINRQCFVRRDGRCGRMRTIVDVDVCRFFVGIAKDEGMIGIRIGNEVVDVSAPVFAANIGHGAGGEVTLGDADGVYFAVTVVIEAVEIPENIACERGWIDAADAWSPESAGRITGLFPNFADALCAFGGIAGIDEV